MALAEGAYDTAADLLAQSLAAFQQVGGSFLVGETLAALAYTTRCLDQRNQARQHLRGALQVAAETGYRNSALQALPLASGP